MGNEEKDWKKKKGNETGWKQPEGKKTRGKGEVKIVGHRACL